MAFSEVLVSAVILAISTQTSLHSWSRITASTQRQNALEQALLQADQQLLAARRLLRRSPAAGCALSPDHLDQQLSPRCCRRPRGFSAAGSRIRSPAVFGCGWP